MGFKYEIGNIIAGKKHRRLDTQDKRVRELAPLLSPSIIPEVKQSKTTRNHSTLE